MAVRNGRDGIGNDVVDDAVDDVVDDVVEKGWAATSGNDGRVGRIRKC
jgi:hypothetical protein